MDFNFDFTANEDFGLAKTFTRAPLGTIAPNAASDPMISSNDGQFESQQAFQAAADPNEVKVDGFNFKLAPCENQVAFQASLKTMAPKVTQNNKGTTTLAFKFKHGVMVAVDARATQGSFIASNEVRKVIEINDFLIGTMAGGAADCLFWEKYVAMLCRIHELRHGEKPSVAMASMILCSIMRQYRGRGLSMGTMFTGSDKTGASLYYIDDDATRLAGNLFAVGSGGTFAYGVLDTNYRYDMEIKEAVDLGIRAIASATYRDAASGGVVRIYHITNNGYWEIIHDALDVSEDHYKFEQSKGHKGDGRENMPTKFI